MCNLQTSRFGLVNISGLLWHIKHPWKQQFKKVINNNITRSSGCSNHYWFLYHLYQLTTFCDMLWAIDLGSTIQWSSSQSLSLVFSGKHSSFTVPAQQLSKTAFLRWPKAEREWCQHTRKILERIVMLYCPHQICGFEMCFRIWMWYCVMSMLFFLCQQIHFFGYSHEIRGSGLKCFTMLHAGLSSKQRAEVPPNVWALAVWFMLRYISICCVCGGMSLQSWSPDRMYPFAAGEDWKGNGFQRTLTLSLST